MALVSIIIPAFNEEKLLPATLAAIRKAAPALHDAGHTTEIIVCDNNSTDRTSAVATAAGARVVFEPVNQIARARNTGAAAAMGEWLIFVDADSQVSRELFDAVAGALKDDSLLAGGTTVSMPSPSWVATAGANLWNFVSRFMNWAAGSFIFCRVEAFRTVKGFNQTLYASEEIELFNKLKLLARQRRQRIRILNVPLVTSDRKLHLYTRWEKISFALRALFRMNATVTSREACAIWYDGRR